MRQPTLRLALLLAVRAPPLAARPSLAAPASKRRRVGHSGAHRIVHGAWRGPSVRRGGQRHAGQSTQRSGELDGGRVSDRGDGGVRWHRDGDHNGASGHDSIRATAGGVTGAAIARVLPQPAGKLVFVSVVNQNGQVFVKDFSTAAPHLQVTNGTGAIGGLAVDQATRMIFFTRGVIPNTDLFRMNEDGTGLLNLTNEALSANQGPSINPVTHSASSRGGRMASRKSSGYPRKAPV